MILTLEFENKFDQFWVKPDGRPYLIAEIGVNHEGSVTQAKNLIKLAAASGADCVKLQTYKAGNLARRDSPAYWDTNEETSSTQFELFSKYDGLGQQDYEDLSKFANSLGIDFASTPFDLESVEFLAPLVPFFKVASADLTYTDLLRKVANTGKPVVISTGGSSMAEILEAISELGKAGCTQIAVMHCILSYPTIAADASLSMIRVLEQQLPGMRLGYSDHTRAEDGLLAPLAAMSMGARIIEKHFTDDKSRKGNDHYHAMDPADFQLLRKYADQLTELVGNQKTRQPLECELPARANARRSLVATKPLPSGHQITKADFTAKRPGDGLSPTLADSLVGQTLTTPIGPDEPFTAQHVS